MSEGAVVERYARAIFEMGVESGALSEVSGGLDRFAEIYAENAELRGILENPAVEESEQAGLISELGKALGLGASTVNAVRLLAERRRLRVVREISERVRLLSDQKEGIVRATVTSAVPLSDAYCERLVRELEAVTERKVALERREDPSLIAGIVTRIGDLVIDGSVRGRLQGIERRLLQS
ncbi:MAG TPA: F0F1 ATP synthase subunit delta [Polyangiaceae bacterium]|jgi:F-type H+-transporting ATPase subunit delta